MDGVDHPVAIDSASPLSYPLDTAPAFGDALDIASGVKWLRMPLPGSLQAINVWAIADGDGWAIVDTGLGTAETVEVWRAAIAGPLNGLKVTRVFVTHMHPDHIGAASWLTREYGCPLWITRLEFLTCRSLAADTGRPAPPDGIDFYRAAGWNDEEISAYRGRFGGFGRGLHALPDSFHRIEGGDEIKIGDHTWTVVVGSGHSPEHACLYCPALKLFISGDQVLPKISSNVSVFPTEPDGDPLTDWLTSLARLKEHVPDDVLVLPAHNEPFHGLWARLDQLIDHHESALQRLEAALGFPQRAIDVFPLLFRRKIEGRVLGMATGESLAHLNCLLRRGRLFRWPDPAGVNWYGVFRPQT